MSSISETDLVLPTMDVHGLPMSDSDMRHPFPTFDLYQTMHCAAFNTDDVIILQDESSDEDFQFVYSIVPFSHNSF